MYLIFPFDIVLLKGLILAAGKEVGFSISWLRRGHPLLKLGDLSVEASQSLRLLLDQLRLPIVKSLSTSMMVVLINW